MGLAPVPGGGALVALVAGALFPYLYARAAVSLEVLKGFSLACLLFVAALYLQPASSVGAHTLLPVYLAAFAFDARSVYWRWSVPVLLAWAVLVPLALHGSYAILLHALFGLIAWIGGRLLGGAPPPRGEGGGEAQSTRLLDLR
jgi:hypothetical protein